MDEKNDATTPEPMSVSVEPKIEEAALAATPEVPTEPVAAAPDVAPAPEPVTPAPEQPAITIPDQPAAATDAPATEQNKASSWKLILCVVLLAAFVGLLIYYWTTGAF